MPRHHLVPQMLLRRFATPSERLMMRARVGDEPAKLTSVKNACAEVGFYKIPTEDVAESHRAGHNPELVESILSQIEGKTGPVIDRVLDGQVPLSAEDKYQLGLFMAIQYTRGWRFREDLIQLANLFARKHLQESLTRSSIEDHLKKSGLPRDEAAVDSFMDEVLTGSWRVMPSGPEAIQLSLRYALEVVHPRLFLKTWRLLQFDEPSLLISDAPVVLWRPPAPGEDVAPVGITDAEAIWMPLDRKHAVALTNSG